MLLVTLGTVCLFVGFSVCLSCKVELVEEDACMQLFVVFWGLELYCPIS